ncbi:transcription factor [Fusarium tjaetaba]|uniref:Transcription factor n=1 Tax=Fusarium tjaetaba TaxID=1567544 RepID=A0A8H5RZK6_9HYPO|nr:transcription factor [Fusarium tjaetaba]KAF5642777.1 transcription factor [Fusarium tjaetaba]
MSIFQDARNGTLSKYKIDTYLKTDPNILESIDPSTGNTPLGTAVVAGIPNVVENLLKKGAKADAPSRDGETPLLLATWMTTKERPRIVQLLLASTPAGSVDSTTDAAGNKTPLMFAIQKRDIQSIRNLRRAGASLTVKNAAGTTAQDDAVATKDMAVVRALDPDKERGLSGMVTDMVLAFLLYIVAWVNGALEDAVRRASGLSGEDNPQIDGKVNKGLTPNKNQFQRNVDKYVNENPVLKNFFKDRPDFIQEVAKKAANLEKEDEPLGDKDTLPKTIKVSLHQQLTMKTDDSSSMKREGRWANQKALIGRIAKITTKILPDGEGVALRFINQDIDNSSNLTFDQISNIIQPMSWQPDGDTDIGTNLKRKILEPLVYAKIANKTFDRPLLVSISTDGMPEPENKQELANAIVECGNKLEAANLPRGSMASPTLQALCWVILADRVLPGVKFMIGQVGTASSAEQFLDSLRENQSIKNVTFVTSEKLDEKFSEFNENEGKLDRWLIETLFTPLADADTGN